MINIANIDGPIVTYLMHLLLINFYILYNNLILFNVGNIVSRVYRERYHLIKWIKKSINYTIDKSFLYVISYNSLFDDYKFSLSLSRFYKHTHARIRIYAHSLIFRSFREFQNRRFFYLYLNHHFKPKKKRKKNDWNNDSMKIFVF